MQRWTGSTRVRSYRFSSQKSMLIYLPPCARQDDGRRTVRVQELWLSPGRVSSWSSRVTGELLVHGRLFVLSPIMLGVPTRAAAAGVVACPDSSSRPARPENSATPRSTSAGSYSLRSNGGD